MNTNTKTSRRSILASLFALPTLAIPARSATPPPPRRIQWLKLTDEILGAGDFWSYGNPSHVHSDELCGKTPNGNPYRSVSMMAVGPENFGKPANVPYQYKREEGAYWRPVGLIE
jgi:hypothetical protein